MWFAFRHLQNEFAPEHNIAWQEIKEQVTVVRHEEGVLALLPENIENDTIKVSCSNRESGGSSRQYHSLW